MKTNFCNSHLVLRFCSVIVVLLLCGINNANGQIATCNTATTISNIGIDSDVNANTAFPNTDDWFLNSLYPGTGIGIIGTSAATAQPPLKISTADFTTMLQGASSAVGRNRTYVQRMSVPYLTIHNNMLLLDAFAARDNITSGSAADSTVFSSGGDKNGDNPSTWSIGTGGVQQKNDIIDVGGHLRRNLTTNELWGFAYSSILAPSGDGYSDVEIFRTIPAITGGILANSGPALTGGHSSFKFNSTGAIQEPGDVLVSINYGSSSGVASVRIWINPSNVNGSNQDTAWLNSQPGRPFTFTGDFITGLNANGYGYAEIKSKTPTACLVYSTLNTSSTPAGAWGNLSGSGANYTSTIDPSQLVEIAINFTQFGLDLRTTSGDCYNIFGAVLFKTRSSSSWSSELKDVAGPFTFGNFTEVQANAGSDKIINCNQSQVTLTGGSLTPGATFSWSTLGGNFVSATNIAQPIVDQPGTYILSVVSPTFATCVSRDTVIVVADLIAPMAYAGNDIVIDCNSGPAVSINATATSGASIVWTALSGGNIVSGFNTVNPTVNAAASYLMTATNTTNGCAATDTVEVTLFLSQPNFVGETVTNPSCNGGCDGSISISLSTPHNPITYTWSNGATSASITGLCAGVYTVTASGTNGCTFSKSYTLTAPAALVATLTPTQVLCHGNTTGSVNVSVSGGTSPYTFTWSNGATTQNLSNTAAGSYTVTITDSKNCSFTGSATISQPTAPLSVITTKADVMCRNDATGSVLSMVTGGTTPYTYTWSNGAGTNNITNLVAGTYTVTITDANNCTSTSSQTVVQPAAVLSGSLTATAVLCNSGNNGSISSSINGGTTPYTYAWSNGATTAGINGLSAGNYSVTVTDAHGCSINMTSAVTQPADPLATSAVTTDILCHANTTGAINLTVTGGTTPYTYYWSNNSTSQDISNLPAGNYSVTVTDANNCTTSYSATLSQPAAALTVSTTKTDILCRNDLTGVVNTTVTGGTTPYSYLWSNAATTSSISGLASGTYSVTITDANNCTTVASVTLTQPAAILSGTLTPSAVLCNSGNTGSITSAIAGGTAPYTYVWSNAATTSSISNLVAGTYTVTVTDNNGCSISLTSTVTQPAAPLAASAVTTDILCHANTTGAINLTVTGGTTPYTYYWSNNATSQDISNLSAGFYAVTVTDQNGCTINYSANLSQPAAPLFATTSKTDILCRNDLSGEVVTNVTGGTTPYTYNWSNGATTASISGLAAGTYTVTITDAHNCSTTVSTILIQPAQILAGTLTTTAVSCNSGNNGAITSAITGGTVPYQYNWSNGSATPGINGVTAGTYTLTVTDAHGCSITRTATISEPAAPLNATVSPTHVLCYGNSTGAIDLTVTGGTAAYTYIWNNNATSQDINNIPAGAYQVNITDAMGCTFSASAIITEPAGPLQTVISSTAVKCHAGTDGQAEITATGGTSPYTYLWSNGATTADNNNITAGTYTVTVTDANGCSSVKSVTVTEPSAALTLSETHRNLSCYAQPQGAINLSVNGGTPAYSYNWSNGFTTQDITQLPASIYNVTVTDANGCTETLSVEVTQPAGQLHVSSTLNHVNCNAGSDGEITLTLTSGTTPYGVIWSTGATSYSINNLATGAYTATVTDANGCYLEVTNFIQQPSAPLSATDSITPVYCFGEATGSIYTTVAGGTSPYTYLWSNNATTAEITNLTAGTYSVTVTDAQACTFTSTYVVNQPAAALTITSNVTQPNCVNINDGNIDLTITGGTAPYAILWSSGETSEDLSNLAPGTYTILVTDAVNCTATGTYIIDFTAPLLTVSGTSTAVLCHGDSTGALNITATGGTTPYSYAWSNGATSASISQLTTGNYSVIVTDVNGCTAAYSNIVAEPAAALTVTETHTAVACFGNASGSIDLTSSNGTPGYSYLWSDGNTDEDRINLITGNYSVTVTDANGCTFPLSINIQQPAAPLNATGALTNILCNSNSTGSVQLTTSGGTTPYTYAWSNGSTTSSIQNLVAGTYSVIVTDANNCTFQDSYTLTEPVAAISISATTQQVSCTGISNGSITLAVNGGTPSYTYSWSNGATTRDLTALPAASYTVTVTDANNCSATHTVNLSQPLEVLTVTGNVKDANCIYGLLGNVVISPTGGTLPYTFIWSNGNTSQNLNNVLPGTYLVTVTDANGCIAGQEFLIADLSTLSVQADGNTTICVGNTVTISAQFSQPVTAGLQWHYNGAPLIGANTASFTTPVAGTYTLIATTACGSYTSNSIEVAVRSLNSVMISSEAIICPGESVQLTAGGGVEYSWSPGAGLSDSTSANPVASPTTTTEYSVLVKDDFGCTARASVIINVECDTLDIPNGFSPNGDGTNDTFVIDGLSQYPVNMLWIYNRWGNLVYKKQNYDNTWDGRSNVSGVVMGQELPNGTYYYLLDLKLDKQPFKGFVVIRR